MGVREKILGPRVTISDLDLRWLPNLCVRGQILGPRVTVSDLDLIWTDLRWLPKPPISDLDLRWLPKQPISEFGNLVKGKSVKFETP